jgi:glycosyltransferase involved in cell wall biosynthesis
MFMVGSCKNSKVKKKAMLEEMLTNQEQIHEDVHSFSIPPAAYSSIQMHQNRMQIALIHDGTEKFYDESIAASDTLDALLEHLQRIAQQQYKKIVATSFEGHDLDEEQVKSRLWLQHDIVPYAVKQTDGVSLSEQAERVASCFDDETIVYPQVVDFREVEVADLVSLDDYRQTVSSDDFARLLSLASSFKGKKLVFINATPRGGGVALMRHALIRLFRLLGVDAHWHALVPRKEAFDITKTLFHNVLQAVALPSVELLAKDKELYEAWMHENALVLDSVYRQADVIVIDDPQPAGLIPFIKQANPAVKIIYRSHIQIVGKLASKPGTSQYTTWNFLWHFIRQADVFVSHPTPMFIPDNVPAEKIFYMPATTDPLDGLNKPLTEAQMAYYLQIFNLLLCANGQIPLDEARPYIVQIARFDPSKGIPDVLEAYWKLRTRLERDGALLPQLIIAGNDSIDDPDGVPIYRRIKEMLASEPYIRFADDIKVVRLPHRDQILNTLLRKSAVVLQLSHKEGFEVKVTEALMKGKPVIAYKVGGIPLQIEHGLTGYLVEVRDTAQVAQHLYDLLTDADLYKEMSSAAATYANTQYLTVPNTICWLYLATGLVFGELPAGYSQWVKVLVDEICAAKVSL